MNVTPIRKRSRREFGAIYVQRVEDGWSIDHATSDRGSFGNYAEFPTLAEAFAAAVVLLREVGPCDLKLNDEVQ